jgi:hypothetical protein
MIARRANPFEFSNTPNDPRTRKPASPCVSHLFFLVNTFVAAEMQYGWCLSATSQQSSDTTDRILVSRAINLFRTSYYNANVGQRMNSWIAAELQSHLLLKLHCRSGLLDSQAAQVAATDAGTSALMLLHEQPTHHSGAQPSVHHHDSEVQLGHIDQKFQTWAACPYLAAMLLARPADWLCFWQASQPSSVAVTPKPARACLWSTPLKHNMRGQIPTSFSSSCCTPATQCPVAPSNNSASAGQHPQQQCIPPPDG